jgi:RHS repeat-associated protein
MTTDQSGGVVARYDFAPFGEGPAAGNEPRQFAGKERDAGTNFDYFGARYYSSLFGRFTTPDSMTKADVATMSPQLWNRYVYAVDNPLRLIDRDGHWPTSIHNDIIKAAFPGLSPAQREVLRVASEDADYKLEIDGLPSQDPANSFVHSMSNGRDGESREYAAARAQSWTATNESRARGLQAAFEASGRNGLSDDALAAFGLALHTVTDATSPSHRGNQEWYGTKGASVKESALRKVAALKHVAREIAISPSEMDAAVDAARAAFGATFGDDALKAAIR